MGLADIVADSLESEQIRKGIGKAGVRIFNNSFEERGVDEEGGFLGWVWNAAKRFLGLLVDAFAKLINFTLTGIWGLFVSTAQYIWNFNWNITDKQIQQQINQKWAALAGMLGGTVGNFVGYLACGAVPGAVIFCFNEPLGAYVLANVGEELIEEFVSNVSVLARYTFSSTVQSFLLQKFKNVRNFLKSNSALVGRIFGSGAENLIKAWGAEGSKPWSFAKNMEDFVESIDNSFVQNFVEEFLEEAWDGCVEAGYVVANSIDSYLAGERFKRQQMPPLGRNRVVEIKPDRSIDDQRIILAGPEEALKPVVVQTLTNYQMWEDKDIGQFVGNPVDDYLRAKPQTIRLVIQFYSSQQPPWKGTETQRLVAATYAIPDIEPAKLDWQTIKLACGGENGYMWGRFRATGLLDNGRQMQVMGHTKEEAEDRLRALLAISKAKILKKPTISEDRQEDIKGAYLKQPTRIYPAYFTILNQYKVPGALGSGVPFASGNYIRKKDRINLWTTEEPDGYKERIQELLKKPGAENETTN
jgi:hypothetical protein